MFFFDFLGIECKLKLKLRHWRPGENQSQGRSPLAGTGSRLLANWPRNLSTSFLLFFFSLFSFSLSAYLGSFLNVDIYTYTCVSCILFTLMRTNASRTIARLWPDKPQLDLSNPFSSRISATWVEENWSFNLPVQYRFRFIISLMKFVFFLYI